MVLVQSTSLQGTADQLTTPSLSFSSNNTAGNIIVVFVSNETDQSSSGPDANVSDSNLNSYSGIDGAFAYFQGTAGNGNTTATNHIYWATSIAGGANTVSLDFSGSFTNSGNFRPYNLVIAEFSAASTLVAHNHGSGTSSTADAGSVTSSSSNSLFVALASIVDSQTCTISTPTNYTSIASDNNAGASANVMAFNAAYFISSAAQDAQFSLSNSQTWGAAAGVMVTPVAAGASKLYQQAGFVLCPA